LFVFRHPVGPSHPWRACLSLSEPRNASPDESSNDLDEMSAVDDDITP
jgi:hypothetical protein